MRDTGFLGSVLVVVALSLAAASASAQQCDASDIRGTWTVHFQWSIDGVYADDGTVDEIPLHGWFDCAVVIRSDTGRVNKNQSFCKDDLGDRLAVRRGAFKLRRNCSVNASLALRYDGSRTFNLIFRSMRLSTPKAVFSGVGDFSGDGTFQVTGLRNVRVRSARQGQARTSGGL